MAERSPSWRPPCRGEHANQTEGTAPTGADGAVRAAGVRRYNSLQAILRESATPVVPSGESRLRRMPTSRESAVPGRWAKQISIVGATLPLWQQGCPRGCNIEATRDHFEGDFPTLPASTARTPRIPPVRKGA